MLKQLSGYSTHKGIDPLTLQKILSGEQNRRQIIQAYIVLIIFEERGSGSSREDREQTLRKEQRAERASREHDMTHETPLFASDREL